MLCELRYVICQKFILTDNFIEPITNWKLTRIFRNHKAYWSFSEPSEQKLIFVNKMLIDCNESYAPDV